MSNKMSKKSVAQNYAFLAVMLAAMVGGCILGWVKPAWGTAIKPFGTVFINMMFCIVVPMVFASIASAVANMGNRKRAGKIMGITIGTFIVTGADGTSQTVTVSPLPQQIAWGEKAFTNAEKFYLVGASKADADADNLAAVCFFFKHDSANNAT